MIMTMKKEATTMMVLDDHDFEGSSNDGTKRS
jgi:hypothetical protein